MEIQRFCTECGESRSLVPTVAQFCVRCGHRFRQNKFQPKPPSAPPTPTPATKTPSKPSKTPSPILRALTRRTRTNFPSATKLKGSMSMRTFFNTENSRSSSKGSGKGSGKNNAKSSSNKYLNIDPSSPSSSGSSSSKSASGFSSPVYVPQLDISFETPDSSSSLFSLSSSGQSHTSKPSSPSDKSTSSTSISVTTDDCKRNRTYNSGSSQKSLSSVSSAVSSSASSSKRVPSFGSSGSSKRSLSSGAAGASFNKRNSAGAVNGTGNVAKKKNQILGASAHPLGKKRNSSLKYRSGVLMRAATDQPPDTGSTSCATGSGTGGGHVGHGVGGGRRAMSSGSKSNPPSRVPSLYKPSPPGTPPPRDPDSATATANGSRASTPKDASMLPKAFSIGSAALKARAETFGSAAKRSAASSPSSPVNTSGSGSASGAASFSSRVNPLSMAAADRAGGSCCYICEALFSTTTPAYSCRTCYNTVCKRHSSDHRSDTGLCDVCKEDCNQHRAAEPIPPTATGGRYGHVTPKPGLYQLDTIKMFQASEKEPSSAAVPDAGAESKAPRDSASLNKPRGSVPHPPKLGARSLSARDLTRPASPKQAAGKAAQTAPRPRNGGSSSSQGRSSSTTSSRFTLRRQRKKPSHHDQDNGVRTTPVTSRRTPTLSWRKKPRSDGSADGGGDGSVDGSDGSDPTPRSSPTLSRRPAKDKPTDLTDLCPLIMEGITICLNRPIRPPSKSKRKSDAAEKVFYNDLNANSEVFQFQDYAPVCFQELRQSYGIDLQAFRESLRHITGGHVGEGKSGMYFYHSDDKRYVLKTINREELKFFRRILPSYFSHMRENPHTLLSRFFGMHKITLSNEKRIRFVIMNNVFETNLKIHTMFDLKGSTRNREVPEDKIESTKVLKDLNYNDTMYFGPKQKSVVLRQMDRDLVLLKECQIMDFSLLLGTHKGTKANIERHYRPPITDASLDDPHTRTADGRMVSIFQGTCGGLPSYDKHGEPTYHVYFLGIIDILQEFNIRKKLESSYKTRKHKHQEISAVESTRYADRFRDFMEARMA